MFHYYESLFTDYLAKSFLFGYDSGVMTDGELPSNRRRGVMHQLQ
jgi:hypothetical protein